MFIQILWIVLALVLLVLCAVLLVFEIFIPSLGLLTVAALMSLAGAFFRSGIQPAGSVSGFLPF